MAFYNVSFAGCLSAFMSVDICFIYAYFNELMDGLICFNVLYVSYFLLHVYMYTWPGILLWYVTDNFWSIILTGLFLLIHTSSLFTLFDPYVPCYLFVVFHPTREFFIHWGLHHYRWRAAKFDLCLALIANEQWGFFSVLLLLGHGASVCNGHLRGPVTLKPIAERLAV